MIFKGPVRNIFKLQQLDSVSSQHQRKEMRSCGTPSAVCSLTTRGSLVFHTGPSKGTTASLKSFSSRSPASRRTPTGSRQLKVKPLEGFLSRCQHLFICDNHTMSKWWVESPSRGFVAALIIGLSFFLFFFKRKMLLMRTHAIRSAEVWKLAHGSLADCSVLDERSHIVKNIYIDIYIYISPWWPPSPRL